MSAHFEPMVSPFTGKCIEQAIERRAGWEKRLAECLERSRQSDSDAINARVSRENITYAIQHGIPFRRVISCPP